MTGLLLCLVLGLAPIGGHAYKDTVICPNCGSDNVIAAFYGLPSEEAEELIAKGELMVLGCEPRDGEPLDASWYCKDCREVW